MAALIGQRGQRNLDVLYDASGTITTGGTAQLVLPRATTRCFLLLSNPSTTNMYFDFGSARATAALTSGAVSSITVTNAGMGFSKAPIVTFLGGASAQSLSPTNTQTGTADALCVNNPATAHCVMTGTAPNMSISSIVIDNPGSGYDFPPYIQITNDPLDFFGVAAAVANAGIGLVAGGGTLLLDTFVPIDQISVYCATTGAAYTCKYAI